ncbi:MAG TPA: efflux RND transporter periplasmic adaptor subunit [Gammaproteobacteria bacterium]|nr:efflux RND transporter periplasmic adaptor subunit [Gammaproteobacteria bacterium]
MKVWIPMSLLLAAVGAAAWLGQERLLGTSGGAPAGRGGKTLAVPVEVADIERGAIERRREFTGTLEARAEFVVAPKVSGRIEEIAVDLADTVTRGQLVAKLDDDEFVQAVAQVQADWAVAKANVAEARSLLEIAERELERIERLQQRGVASASQRDAAKADQLAKRAHVEVTRAQLTRAEAELEAARIRLGYTQVAANWRGGGEERVVAERYVDEGETVSANAPLLRIVEIDPITAVFFVTERDYALLKPEQVAVLRTDAFPDEAFEGRIARIAPVFRESTRQARVEAWLDNPGLRLKPGMFVRATVVLDRVAETTIVPEQALVRRDGRDGVFVLDADGKSVSWRQVTVGIRQGNLVQVEGEGLGTRVVTLGQQLLDDGSPVSVESGI